MLVLMHREIQRIMGLPNVRYRSVNKGAYRSVRGIAVNGLAEGFCNASQKASNSDNGSIGSTSYYVIIFSLASHEYCKICFKPSNKTFVIGSSPGY
jgi:hypothetical protein